MGLIFVTVGTQRNYIIDLLTTKRQKELLNKWRN